MRDAGRLHGFPVALFAVTLLFTAWLVGPPACAALRIGMAASTLAAVIARAGRRPGLLGIGAGSLGFVVRKLRTGQKAAAISSP